MKQYKTIKSICISIILISLIIIIFCAIILFANQNKNTLQSDTINIKNTKPITIIPVVENNFNENNEEVVIEEKSEIIEEKITKNKYRIVIDACAQNEEILGGEAMGPNSDILVQKCEKQYIGLSTGLEESKLNLNVAKMLKNKLIDSGYEVIMTRETNNVSLSNMERAAIADEADADLYIRIKTNFSLNPLDKGIVIYCPSSENIWTKNIYEKSRKVSEEIVKEIGSCTGDIIVGVKDFDQSAAMNWSIIPTTTINIGYLSNPETEMLLNTQEYQEEIANGIYLGIEKYFEEY